VTVDKLEEALVVASPTAFAALADELQALAGNRTASTADTASANSQRGKFTAADRERIQELFGHLGSLPDGIETNIAEIRSAVSAIPPSAIAAEPDWMKFARALAHEAAVYKGQSEELWKILDSASRVAPGYDEPENRTRWLRLIGEAFDREKPITIATVFDLAKKHGWQVWSPADEATSASGASQANAQQTSSRRATPIASLPLIPPKRRWLHGNDLKRGAVSLLVAPRWPREINMVAHLCSSMRIWSSAAQRSRVRGSFARFIS
jgi:Primase C terminal 2 (PriCT-2)